MSNMILVNDNGIEISTVEDCMIYILDYYGNNSSYSADIESDFYSLLIEEDIMDDMDFSLDNLIQGYKLLNSIEPNCWKIEEV